MLDIARFPEFVVVVMVVVPFAELVEELSPGRTNSVVSATGDPLADAESALDVVDEVTTG